jgi:glutamate-5-semialdehyde dehydrogenase
MSCEELAQKAKEASFALQSASLEQKSKALHRIRDYLDKNKKEIIKANKLDLEQAETQVKSGKLSESLFKRLDLAGNDDLKYQTLLDGILDVDRLSDPTGQVTLATKLDDGLELYRVSCPVGVLLIIFEARPEVVVQISTLALKSGNAVILKGGKEAHHSNAALHKALQSALESLRDADGKCAIPPESVQLVSTRDEIASLLKQDRFIDLVIPRGSNEFVRYVKDNTRIPVLGHADGLCSIYVDQGADVNKAKSVVCDAKTNYTAACNAAETLLIHKNSLDILSDIAKALIALKVELRCDAISLKELQSKLDSQHVKSIKAAVDEDFDTEFLDLIMAVKVVDSFQQAMDHINAHGSHHTDVIVTESEDRAEQFMRTIDSAGVYWNASSRFADGFRYGFGAEIGVRHGILANLPVGLD